MNENRICLAIANSIPSEELFGEFVKKAISCGILEFKAYGKYGELLHDLFDETMVELEVHNNYPFIDVMITKDSQETLKDVFWQCFYASCLPETADYNQIKIVCIDFDEIDRTYELKNYLKRF